MRVRARRPDEAAPEEEVARQAVDAPDLRSLTPDTIRALQARAGNVAVARMVATMARFVDYDATAQIIHDACEGLGIDEAAIFAALGRDVPLAARRAPGCRRWRTRRSRWSAGR